MGLPYEPEEKWSVRVRSEEGEGEECEDEEGEECEDEEGEECEDEEGEE